MTFLRLSSTPVPEMAGRPGETFLPPAVVLSHSSRKRTSAFDGSEAGAQLSHGDCKNLARRVPGNRLQEQMTRIVRAIDRLLRTFVCACCGQPRRSDASHMHRHADAADIAEHAQITL